MVMTFAEDCWNGGTLLGTWATARLKSCSATPHVQRCPDIAVRLLLSGRWPCTSVTWKPPHCMQKVAGITARLQRHWNRNGSAQACLSRIWILNWNKTGIIVDTGWCYVSTYPLPPETLMTSNITFPAAYCLAMTIPMRSLAVPPPIVGWGGFYESSQVIVDSMANDAYPLPVWQLEI